MNTATTATTTLPPEPPIRPIPHSQDFQAGVAFGVLLVALPCTARAAWRRWRWSRAARSAPPPTRRVQYPFRTPAPGMAEQIRAVQGLNDI